MLVAVLALGTELKSKSHTQLLPLTILKKHFPLFRIASLAQTTKGKWGSPAAANTYQRCTTDRRDTKKP